MSLRTRIRRLERATSDEMDKIVLEDGRVMSFPPGQVLDTICEVIDAMAREVWEDGAEAEDAETPQWKHPAVVAAMKHSANGLGSFFTTAKDFLSESACPAG